MFKILSNSLVQNIECLGENTALIKQVSIGLERESLRIKENGHLSTEPHAPDLGSALTNPHITTDFSENMLEFVTSPHHSAKEALNELDKIQAFTLSTLQDELLWANSMPPHIASLDEIPVGYYGTSNQGKMKTLYRVGLKNRYGKMMQTITGIHFNFSLNNEFFIALQKGLNNTQSLQDFKTERYLNLVRNVHRFGFVIPYLFGATPFMSKSFLPKELNHFDSFNKEESYLKEGNSFRLSDIGYGNNKCDFDVSFNNVNEYIRDVRHAISTPCENMTKIGVKQDGEYLQINDHILQIENEYYSSIRPKQVPKQGETLLQALESRGIEYVELRSLDIMPHIPTGITLDTMQFIQAFLTTCLLSDAPLFTAKELKIHQKNLKHIAEKGRTEQVQVVLNNHQYKLHDALQFVTEWMHPVCKILGSEFLRVLKQQKQICNNPEQTPAALMIKELQINPTTFQDFYLNQSKKIKAHYQKNNPLTDEDYKKFRALAEASKKQQHDIETAPQIPFEEYLKNYFK